MSSWGKYIGALLGFFIYGVFGALVGFLIGLLAEKIFLKLQKPSFTKLTDQDLDQVRSEFFAATFSVMGFIASLARQQRGDITDVAVRVMDRLGIPKNRRHVCLDYFEEGRAQDFALYNTVVRFNRLHGDQPRLLEMFVELQLYAAYTKGPLTQEEKDTLLGICYQLDFGHSDYDRMENLIKAEFRDSSSGRKTGLFTGWRRDVALSDAYAVLNTTPQASDDEVKQAYRRLTSQHHPDKLVAKGMSDEMMRMAEAKTREIRDAYERIKQMRKI